MKRISFQLLFLFASPLLFGMIGGLRGALIVLGIQRYSQKLPNRKDL
jgi:hypothetical protein